MIHLVFSGLNYSKCVHASWKSKVSSVLALCKRGVLVGTLVQEMESHNRILGLICALHYLYSLSVLQLRRSCHSYTGAGSLLLCWTARAMPFPHSCETSSSKWETAIAKNPFHSQQMKIPLKNTLWWFSSDTRSLTGSSSSSSCMSDSCLALWTTHILHIKTDPPSARAVNIVLEQDLLLQNHNAESESSLTTQLGKNLTVICAWEHCLKLYTLLQIFCLIYF